MVTIHRFKEQDSKFIYSLYLDKSNEEIFQFCGDIKSDEDCKDIENTFGYEVYIIHKDEIPVGFVGLEMIRPEPVVVSLILCVEKQRRGTGIATEVSSEMCDFLLKNKLAKKVVIQFSSHNIHVKNFVEKNKWVFEGKFLKENKIDNIYYDELRYCKMEDL